LAVLRDAEADDPQHLAALDDIQAAVERWQNEWANPTILKVQRSADVEARGLVLEGENRMDGLRRAVLKHRDLNLAQNAAGALATEQALRRMLLLALGVAFVVALVVLAATREVARLITQPVRQLIEASERVGRGDFQPTLPAPMDNEFGILSRSFAQMTSALRQEREELAALNKYSEAVVQCTSEREIYDHVLYSLRERFHPRQVIIFKLNAQENYLEAAATLQPLPEELRDWPVIPEPHNCKAVRMGRRFRANDVRAEPLCPSKFLHPTDGSYYCGPLIAGGVIIGAVRVEGAKDYWTPERESLLESYLSGAASALSNLRLLETMKHEANVDTLTGLYNRRFLEDYARKTLAMGRRKNQPFGIIMMDLDHFKDINDAYGHETGDRILRQFAKTITQAMRETNLAARYGGEEFVVLLPDTDAQACVLVAERIRRAVERMVVQSPTGKLLTDLTVSLGIAVYPDHGQEYEELVQASDKALYESKRAGRNRSTLYVPQEEPAG
jgi:diguanylate cyclase (GGDEF)-like protein